MHGPEADSTLRLLLVEAGKAQIIYEWLGSWSQCMRWISLAAERPILPDQLNAIRRLLDMNQLATIEDVRLLDHDLEALGLRRVDS